MTADCGIERLCFTSGVRLDLSPSSRMPCDRRTDRLTIEQARRAYGRATAQLERDSATHRVLGDSPSANRRPRQSGDDLRHRSIRPEGCERIGRSSCAIRATGSGMREPRCIAFGTSSTVRRTSGHWGSRTPVRCCEMGASRLFRRLSGPQIHCNRVDLEAFVQNGCAVRVALREGESLWFHPMFDASRQDLLSLL